MLNTDYQFSQNKMQKKLSFSLVHSINSESIPFGAFALLLLKSKTFITFIVL